MSAPLYRLYFCSLLNNPLASWNTVKSLNGIQCSHSPWLLQIKNGLTCACQYDKICSVNSQEAPPIEYKIFRLKALFFEAHFQLMSIVLNSKILIYGVQNFASYFISIFVTYWLYSSQFFNSVFLEVESKKQNNLLNCVRRRRHVKRTKK